MKEIIEQYVDSLYVRNASPHTIRNYVSDIDQFCQFAAEKGFDPLKLDRSTARLYLSYLGQKYTNKETVMRKRYSVKAFYKYLREENVVARNEFDYFDNMRVERKLP